MKHIMAVLLLAGVAACQRHETSNTEMPVPEPTGNLQDAERVPAPSADIGSAALPAPELEGATTAAGHWRFQVRSEEHTSELQSIMSFSYAVFCLKKKK